MLAYSSSRGEQISVMCLYKVFGVAIMQVHRLLTHAARTPTHPASTLVTAGSLLVLSMQQLQLLGSTDRS